MGSTPPRRPWHERETGVGKEEEEPKRSPRIESVGPVRSDGVPPGQWLQWLSHAGPPLVLRVPRGWRSRWCWACWRFWWWRTGWGSSGARRRRRDVRDGQRNDRPRRRSRARGGQRHTRGKYPAAGGSRTAANGSGGHAAPDDRRRGGRSARTGIQLHGHGPPESARCAAAGAIHQRSGRRNHPRAAERRRHVPRRRHRARLQEHRQRRGPSRTATVCWRSDGPGSATTTAAAASWQTCTSPDTTGDDAAEKRYHAGLSVLSRSAFRPAFRLIVRSKAMAPR